MSRRSMEEIQNGKIFMELEGVLLELYPPFGAVYGPRERAHWEDDLLNIDAEQAACCLEASQNLLTSLSPTARETILDIIYARWGS